MTYNYFIYVFIINFAIISVKSLTENSSIIANFSNDYEVVFLSVVFRHGDRTPENLYPNDPNTEDKFYPIGLGGLTPAGKARAYELGTQLRYQYKEFLGETFIPYMVMGRSTDVERTKMSLMLVLSALYPPRDKQIWNPILNWQPIPINYNPVEKDFLIPLICPIYLKELIRVQNTDDVKQQVVKFNQLMVNLTQWTGKTINSLTDMLLLYHTLMAENSMGLELPKWTHDIFPTGLLLDATILRLKILNFNTKLRKLFSGRLIENIIVPMRGIVEGTINNKRKIQLYSVHETNVASLLITLGIFKPHVPDYSSGVIVELLRDRFNRYYIRIRYYLGIQPVMKVLSIPGCEMEPCPFNEFIYLMRHVIPTDEDVSCPH